MSGVNNSPSRPASPPQKPAEPSKKPQSPAPEEDGLFRDEQSSSDGWHKTDGPGSGGGYGIRSTPQDGVTRSDDAIAPTNSDSDDLFTDKVDIKFPPRK